MQKLDVKQLRCISNVVLRTSSPLSPTFSTLPFTRFYGRDPPRTHLTVGVPREACQFTLIVARGLLCHCDY